MSIGPGVTQAQLSQALSNVAAAWLHAATVSQALYAQVNGAGGQSWLETPLGFDPADAGAIMALVGQYNQAAGLIDGTQALAAPFDFAQAFAAVLDPASITAP